MDPNSTLVMHIVDADHIVSVNDAVVISRVGYVYLRRLVESALIEHIFNFNVYITASNLDNNMSRLLFEVIPFLLKGH